MKQYNAKRGGTKAEALSEMASPSAKKHSGLHAMTK